jgi:thiol-disulfide isomerase/thioredoxin
VGAFGDFQCPFCRRLAGTLHALHEEYPEDVRVVFLQFPMSLDCTAATLARTMHPEACRAAEASLCGGDQGRFWETHDLLYQDASRLGAPLYAAIPGRLGLDPAAFQACQRSDATVARVRAQTALGVAAGVTGTPNSFVNGRSLSGAQPIEVFRAVVEAELAGTQGVLDLQVALGTERIGTVPAFDPAAIGHLAHPYRIDRFEAAIEDGRAVAAPGRPVAAGVTWYEAKAACEAAGKRLCTEEEWLSSCMGSRPIDADGDGAFADDVPTGRFYAYGGLYREGICPDSRPMDAPGALTAGTHPECVSPDGVYDLHGNVKEWVGLDPSLAAVMGGSWFSEESARCTYHRDDVAPSSVDDSVGFRCCAGDVEQPDLSALTGRKVGDALAPFGVDLLSGGGTLTSADLAGHPTILTFWASWCGPCRKEMPALDALFEKYADQGLRVIGVTIDERPADARAWIQAESIGFPIGLDPDSALHHSFGASSVPTTFWIGRDGMIRLRTIGLPSGGDRRLDELAQQLLAP